MVDKSPSGGYNREKQEKSWGDERPGVMIMTKADKYLVEDIKNILENGFQDVDPRPKYEDGTPAHTISVNHVMRKYDLSKGEFPICTLRPQAWKTGVREIFTIYQKPTNDLAEMREMGVTWWDPWDIGDGTIGQRYGATVKRYDLIHKIIEDIEKNPYGRRKVMSLWQETDLAETPGLAPCAFLTMWNVRGEFLDMSMVQRSGDMLTASGAGGINEIQYAALLVTSPACSPTSWRTNRFTTVTSTTPTRCSAVRKSRSRTTTANRRTCCSTPHPAVPSRTSPSTTSNSSTTRLRNLS